LRQFENLELTPFGGSSVVVVATATGVNNPHPDYLKSENSRFLILKIISLGLKYIINKQTK
jgi:hypothetical protein